MATHAELDQIAADNDYEFEDGVTTVAEKKQALEDEGFFDSAADDTEDEDEATATTEDAEVPAEPMTYAEEAAAAPESTEDHLLPLILEGTWVILGQGDNIPEELRGHEAVVLVAPMHNQLDPDEFSNRPYQYQDEDDVFTVRTRDQYGATITAVREDFAEVSTTGRVGLPSPG